MSKRRVRPPRLDYQEDILEAIKKVEIEDFPHPARITKILEKLKDMNCTAERRTVYNHLDRLIDKKLIAKVGRGLYSRKITMLTKQICQEFLISEVFEIVPRLEGKAFDDFVSKHLSTFNRLEREYQRKRHVPFLRWRYNRKLRDLQEKKERVERSHVKPVLRDRLEFIEKATEITVLSSKKVDFLNIYKIRKTLAEVLYGWFLHEIDVAESVGQKSSLENLGLNIIVSFEPKRAGAIPSGSTSELEKTVLVYLREFEEFPLIARERAKITGITKERLERIQQQIIQKQKEHDKAEWERSKSA